jgi:peptide/nickel transport system permease protein
VTPSFGAFVLKRLLAAVVFVAVVSGSALTLAHFAPGDAATELILSGAGAQAAAQERARLGLDRPLYIQLGGWIAGLGRFDLGTSSSFHRPVTDLLRERAAPTALLAGAALALATLIGLPLGLLTGSRPRSVLALVVTPISIALVACPPIVGALALLFVGVRTGWLSVAPGHLGVPALALALPLAAMLERLQSQATSEVIAAPDIRAAAARGVPASRLLWIHASRQSLRPVLGIYGVVIGSLFSGSLAVEVVTAWPGLGRLMYDALMGRDLFLVAGCALAGAMFLAAGNLAADIARAVIDPRVTRTS